MIFRALSAETNVSDMPAAARLASRHNDWFVPGLYKNELRRTWSMGLLFAIVLFFAVPVLNLLVFTSNAYNYSHYPEQAYSFLCEYFSVSNPFLTVYACLSGMFCAMVVTEYLFDRRKINFVCSLPVKRHAYLVTKAAANLTWSILAWIPAAILMIPVALVTESMRPYLGMVLGGYIVMLGVWLCIHLYFFGLTMLACCFCGTGVMGGCMLLFVGGYIPVTALSLIGLADMAVSNLDSDYYLSVPFFSSISGVFRVFAKTGSAKSVWFLLGTALLGLILCAVSVLLTVIRQSEKAGTPFAFDRIRDLVKYLLMGLAAILGGMLFEAMSSSGVWSFFWMLFGCVCGAVLCWMLCNTLFFKTPRMMFVGRRGLIVLTVCMMVFSAGARFDVLGMNSYVPSDLMTRSVTLDNRTSLSFRDRDLVSMFNDMAENGIALYEQNGWTGINRVPVEAYKETGFDPDAPSLINISSAVWHTRYALPIAKNLYVDYEDWVQFVKTLTAKEDFADLYFADIIDALEHAKRHFPEETYYVSFSSHKGLKAERGMEYNRRLTAAEILEILEIWREEMRTFGGDAMQQDYSGTLYIRLDDRSFELPMYEAYEKTYAAIEEIDRRGTENSYYSEFDYQKIFTGASVYYGGTLIDTLTEAQFRAMLDDGVMTNYYSTYETPLTLIEPDYRVEVSFHVTETQKYTYVVMEESYVDGVIAYIDVPETQVDKSEYDDTVSASFFYGCVPEEYRQ